MTRVRIVGLRNDLERVTEILHETGLLHLDSTPPESLSLVQRLTPGEERAGRIREIEERLAALRRLEFLLPIPDRRELPAFSSTTLDDLLKELLPEAIRWGSRKDRGEQELHLLRKYEKVLTAFGPLLPGLRESPWLSHLGFLLSTPDEAPMNLLRGLFDSVTGGKYELLVRRVDPETLACLLIHPRELDPEIRDLLRAEGLPEIRLPADFADRPFVESLKGIFERMSRLPGEIAEANGRLRDLAERHGGEIAASRIELTDRLARLSAAASFYGTGQAFLIHGWVPRRALPALRSRLEAGIGPSLLIEEEPIPVESFDRVPVFLRNPVLLRNFERLTRLLTLPRYGSVDPTPWLALFFPLFFGIMVGDAGYGLLLLLIALGIRVRFSHPLVRDLASVFAVASTTAILLGIGFGEYFGFPPERVGLSGLGGWVRREESLPLFLAASVGIGFGHLALGIFLGLRNAARRRNFGEIPLLLGKLFFLSGAVFLAGGWIAGRNLLASIGGGMMGTAVIVLILRERWKGPLDLLKLSGHLLSYARLMGFGAASIYLAYLANFFGETLRPLAVGIGVALFFHALNLLMGLYAPAIQALRLHYVEFFDKFYLAGGIPYRPFKKTFHNSLTPEGGEGRVRG